MLGIWMQPKVPLVGDGSVVGVLVLIGVLLVAAIVTIWTAGRNRTGATVVSLPAPGERKAA